jgi:hypothetical protein
MNHFLLPTPNLNRLKPHRTVTNISAFWPAHPGGYSILPTAPAKVLLRRICWEKKGAFGKNVRTTRRQPAAAAAVRRRLPRGRTRGPAVFDTWLLINLAGARLFFSIFR